VHLVLISMKVDLIRIVLTKTLRVGRKISGIPEYPSNGADNSSLPVNSKMLDGSLTNRRV